MKSWGGAMILKRALPEGTQHSFSLETPLQREIIASQNALGSK